MDPIRTAVKYSLIPLRTLVQLGESFVEGGDATPPPEPAPQPRRAQPRKQAGARRPSPQASRKPKELDDVGLARKVESIIFRDEGVPKGKIDVNAADGVVWLRGEAKTPDMIKALERDASAIPEVKRVENLLHLPKTPAPTRTDTPPTQRKTRSSGSGPTTARKVETSVTEERQPAPLGPNGSPS
jgi:BON domain